MPEQYNFVPEEEQTDGEYNWDCDAGWEPDDSPD